MGGANYMGGQKNLAKARNKDFAVRAEKRYFSLQKLNILSKGGLATSTPSIKCQTSDIQLNHASRRTAFMEGTARIEGPDERYEEVRLPSEGKKSRVLEAMDTSEPVSLRAALNQVLNLKDLAGLSTSRKRLRPGGPKEFIRQLKKRKSETTRSRDGEPIWEQEYIQEHDKPPSYSPQKFGSRSTHSLTLDTYSGNVFDYDDPWKAVGIILGVETAYSDNVNSATSHRAIPVQQNLCVAPYSDSSFFLRSPNHIHQYDPSLLDLPASSPRSHSNTASSGIPIASYGQKSDSPPYNAAFDDEAPEINALVDEDISSKSDQFSSWTNVTAHSATNEETSDFSSWIVMPSSRTYPDSSPGGRGTFEGDFSSWIDVLPTIAGKRYLDIKTDRSDDSFSFSSWIDVSAPPSEGIRHVTNSDDIFAMSSHMSSTRLGHLKLPMPDPKPSHQRPRIISPIQRPSRRVSLAFRPLVSQARLSAPSRPRGFSQESKGSERPGQWSLFSKEELMDSDDE